MLLRKKTIMRHTLSVMITAAVATLPVVHFSTLSAAWTATAKTDKLMLSHTEGIYTAALSEVDDAEASMASAMNAMRASPNAQSTSAIETLQGSTPAVRNASIMNKAKTRLTTVSRCRCTCKGSELLALPAAFSGSCLYLPAQPDRVPHAMW